MLKEKEEKQERKRKREKKIFLPQTHPDEISTRRKRQF